MSSKETSNGLIYLVIYLVWPHQCRHRPKPDAAIELDESSMIYKKPILLFLIFVSFPLNSLMVLGACSIC